VLRDQTQEWYQRNVKRNGLDFLSGPARPDKETQTMPAKAAATKIIDALHQVEAARKSRSLSPARRQ